MIHNTFLIRTSTREVLARTQYWPVEVSNVSLEEFVSTRQELKDGGDDYVELPLIIGDHKFHGMDWVGETILVFITDKGEDESAVFEKMEAAGSTLRRVLTKSGLDTVAANYSSIIEPSITTRLKIALVGEGGVGKTTTLHLLLGDTPPLQYVPTIALNLETVENIRFGNYSLVLWDFAGQERFRTLWRFYFHGADVIFLVCDSTLRNVIISKDILKLIRRDAPKVPVFAMANKQDKPNAMRPEVVQKILGIPTYPMVAIDKSRRDEMLRILMTAAAQYVGVALPDLPASELLKFTDSATEEAIAEVEATHAGIVGADDEEEEFDFVEIVEEVYVDEEGHVIEDTNDYEIVEELVEEIMEDEPVASEEASEEVIATETASEDILVGIMDEDLSVKERQEDIPLTSELTTSSLSSDTTTVPDSPSEPLEFEVPTLGGTTFEQEVSVDIELENEMAATVSEGTDDDRWAFEVEEPTVPSSSEDNGTGMAREIISEALDADEIIAAEIGKVSKEDIDVALEAFACDEVIPRADEPETCDEIDEESLMELESILGPLDKSVGGMGEGTKVEKDYLPIDNETLAELSRLLDLQDSEEED